MFGVSGDSPVVGGCRDLVHLAGDQRQHAPRAELPVFRGSTGLEVANSIKRIQVCIPRPDSVHCGVPEYFRSVGVAAEACYSPCCAQQWGPMHSFAML